MNGSDSPVVSVVVITYNQERYVRQAVESVLSQQTTFPVEILIADDASCDSTPDILLKYKKAYPKKIRLIRRRKNLGPTANVYQLFAAAKGKYLAGLEGDDYWIDDGFLQRQVEFLEQHDEYVATTGRCRVEDKNGNVIPESYDYNNRDFWWFDKPIYTMRDFEQWKMPGHIAAVVYRNFYLEDGFDGSAFFRIDRMVGDRTTVLQLIVRGNIYCYDTPVMAYRYVDARDADNWMATTKAHNRRFEEYRLICRLEGYAASRYDRHPDMTSLKKNKIAAAAIVWWMNKRYEDWKALARILCHEWHPLRDVKVAMEAIRQKRYWMRRGQPEHRVDIE